MLLVLVDEDLEMIRKVARTYEQDLPDAQRKRLGQYFTGLPLGRLLANLALEAETKNILDPMAGTGDLIDATWEAAVGRGISLSHFTLNGIEIDAATAQTCRDRLVAVAKATSALEHNIITGNVFDWLSIAALPRRSFDLVITNPPYVRYQMQSETGQGIDDVRAGLHTILEKTILTEDVSAWQGLAAGYSGLADLSVPAWILSAALVRPGGRLALVVPATWRTRDYADIIRYLLLRCFALEFIVEDQQPGWFSDALVRTQLIVAKRRHPSEVAVPLSNREFWSDSLWVQVTPEAADMKSLVGTAFPSTHPERDFSTWLRNGYSDVKRGLKVRPFNLSREWAELEKRIRRRKWYRILECGRDDLPLFSKNQTIVESVPDAIADLLADKLPPATLTSLEDAGIAVGQGLRTGCNSFFYVTVCGSVSADEVEIEASSLFGIRRFTVPASILRPVLRRQAEVSALTSSKSLCGRVIDLRAWVLPEDHPMVLSAQGAYSASGEMPPSVMPDALAAFVRRAAATSIGTPGKEKLIPDLSAVRTNVRPARNQFITPRFWYMLPDFTPRHVPAAFVPRINHGLPKVFANLDPPLIIDANFSTFWTFKDSWSPYALVALFRSYWCLSFMEALGTPMGGGALKLEATQLRHLPIPALSKEERSALDSAGRTLSADPVTSQFQIDRIIFGAVLNNKKETEEIAAKFRIRAFTLAECRLRKAS